MSTKKANLVCIEGLDGRGKTTQIELLASKLRNDGYKVATVKFPQYDRWTGKLIRSMLKSQFSIDYPNIFQAIHWIDKILHQLLYLPKLLRENDYILFDRWYVSTWAYGLAGGSNKTFTEFMIRMLKVPDLVFIFEGKSKRLEKQDKYESNDTFQKSVELHYTLWKCINPCVVINANDSKEKITSKLFDYVTMLSV